MFLSSHCAFSVRSKTGVVTETRAVKMGGSKLRKALADLIQEKLANLQRIWLEIGIPKVEIELRQESVKEHVTRLFDEMTKEESSFLEKTKTQIGQFEQEIAHIRQKLEIKPMEVKSEESQKKSESLLLKRQQLKTEVDHLRRVAQKWRTNFENVAERSKELCHCLGLPNHFLVDSYNKSVIPSLRDINVLKNHVENLTVVQRNRLQEREKLRESINSLKQELEIEVDRDDAISSFLSKDTALRDSDLSELAGIEEELLRRKQDRIAMLHQLRMKLDALQESQKICFTSFNFDSLKTSNIEEVAKKMDMILSELNRQPVNRCDSKHDNPDEMGSNRTLKQRTPARKLRQRSASDTTITSRRRRMGERVQGTPYQKPLKPFIFGLDGAETAWHTPTKGYSPMKSVSNAKSPSPMKTGSDRKTPSPIKYGSARKSPSPRKFGKS